MALPPLSFSAPSSASAEGAPVAGAPSYAGGGLWNVATSGSRLDNTGSASTSQGVPAGVGDVTQYFPLAFGAFALLILWKTLKN